VSVAHHQPRRVFPKSLRYKRTQRKRTFHRHHHHHRFVVIILFISSSPPSSSAAAFASARASKSLLWRVNAELRELEDLADDISCHFASVNPGTLPYWLLPLPFSSPHTSTVTYWITPCIISHPLLCIVWCLQPKANWTRCFPRACTTTNKKQRNGSLKNALVCERILQVLLIEHCDRDFVTISSILCMSIWNRLPLSNAWFRSHFLSVHLTFQQRRIWSLIKQPFHIPARALSLVHSRATKSYLTFQE